MRVSKDRITTKEE